MQRKYKEKVIVLRVLDSENERLKLSKSYQKKIEKQIEVFTKPEIEILIIIGEDKLDEYNKLKSKTKPSQYCMCDLKIRKVKSYEYVKEYFSEISHLLDCVQQYDRISAHKGL